MTAVAVAASFGAVYTREWVVEVVLELAGYCATKNLVDARAIEPAVGEGAFLGPMVQRLLASCRRQGRPWLDCLESLRAYDIQAFSLAVCRQVVAAVLHEAQVPAVDATRLLDAWLQEADYLLLVGQGVAHAAAAPQLFDEPQERPADYVLGNPPYVRVEHIPAARNTLYRQLFPTMRGRADLYVGFYEAALRQLQPGGVCAFICADRWMLNTYGAALRTFISQGFAVETLLELHEADAFEAAVSAYPAISVIRRAAQQSVVVASATGELELASTSQIVHQLAAVRQQAVTPSLAGLTASQVPQWFTGSEPWTRVSTARQQLLAYLETQFEPLVSAATGTRVGIGVATGADAVFITAEPGAVEAARLVRLARPADVRTGEVRWGGQWLVNPWQQGKLVELAQWPGFAAYVDAHQPALRRRHVVQRNPAAWYRTIDKVDPALYHQPKLYIPDIKNTLFPVLDTGETYPDHNLYFVVSDQWDLEVLGGLLLSDIATFFVECYGVRMRGGYLRMQAQYLRKIRVPASTAISTQLAEQLRQAFRDRDVTAATQAAVQAYRLEHLWPLE